MLGKLFSFSGKSSLYRTGSARCSTTLRGIVPKTEANLLMHSDLWGSGSRRSGEQMREMGVGEKEKIFKRLRDDSKIHNFQHQQKKSKEAQPAPRFERGWRGVDTVMWLCSSEEKVSRECCLEGLQRSDYLFPSPYIPVILPDQHQWASNQGGLTASNLNPVYAS